MEKNRPGITRLTTSQCSRIAGGDPGMSLAGGGYGGGPGGGFSGADMGMANMGIAYAGGPMAVVTIGLPGDAPLSAFDNNLIKAFGTVAGTSAGAFVGGVFTGIGLIGVAAPVGIATGIVVSGVASEGARNLLQWAANERAYAGHVRHAITP